MDDPTRQPAGAAPRWLPATFRALRHRNYRLYFTGQLVSLIGSWVQLTAQAWLAWELTHRASWPAWVSAAQVLPTCVLGPWGGGLADRLPKRPLIFATQAAYLALALLLALLTYVGWITEWRLLAIATVAGVVTAVDLPARLAFVTEMVGREDLVNAVALNSLVFNTARAVGPALAAQLLHDFGAAECFLVNGLSYVAVLFALAWMRLGRESWPGHRPAAPLGETLRFLRGRGDLLLLLVMTAAMAGCGWPLLSLLPALADERLGVGRGGYGGLVSAIGAGALVGALIVATFGSLERRKLFLGGGVVLAAGSLAGLAPVRNYPLALACCVPFGTGLILFLSTGQAVLQLSAADHNRGRVMGVWSMVLSGAQPLGNLLAGASADRWGVADTLARQAAVLAGTAVIVSIIWVISRR
jgi:MFS family permease